MEPAPPSAGNHAVRRLAKSSSRRLLLRVCRVEVVEDLACLQRRLVVAARPPLDSPEYRLEAARVGNGDAADVEEMDGVAQRRECVILVEAETRQQHFVGYAAFDVREPGAVVIEAER